MTSKIAKKSNWVADKDRLEYAVDYFAMSVQFAIQKAMNEKNISKKELAERLGVSSSAVSQFLAKDASNLRIKTVAKIADALEEEFDIFSRRDIQEMKKSGKKASKATDLSCHQNVVDFSKYMHRLSWHDESKSQHRYSTSDVIEELDLAV